MAYTIVKSNGTDTITISDNSLDNRYSVQLVGKNKTNYGAPLNQNFFRLMENFAGSAEPNNPQIGQIWWDSGNKLLKVQSSAGIWKTVSGTMVTEPTEPILGDLWYDTVAKQLKLYNGSQWQIVGTSVTAAGTSGFVPETFTGTGNATFTVSSIYANGFRVAVVSANTIIDTGQSGFTNVYPGINFNTTHGNLATLNGNLSGASASLSANVTAGNLISLGVITSTANVSVGGNLSVAAAAAVSGNISGLNLTIGAISSSGNLTGTNASFSGLITVTGNATAGNLITAGAVSSSTLSVTGVSNLGNVGNVRITGGSNGQVLTTDGTGNLTWAAASGGGGSGTVNSGTATHLAYYATSSTAVSGTGANLIWNGTNLLTVTGNVIASNIAVNSTANVSTLEVITIANVKATTAATSTTSGALRVAGGAGFAGNLHVGGNIVSGNTSTGILSASGAATLSSTLNVTGLITATAGLTTTANVAAGNANITAALTTSTLAVSGTSNLGNVSNVTITGGTNGYVLSTNGSGGLSWVAMSGGGGGSGTVVSGGADALAYYTAVGTTVAGTTNMTWNNTSYVLTVTGTANATTLNISGVATTNTANVTATTAATSTTSGALRVAGGIGVAGNVYSGGILNINGNANVGNIGATAGVFTGAISGSTTLSLTGNANVGNIGATRGVFTNLVGTIESGSASQPNITSLGTLANLTVSGNMTIDTNTLFVDSVNDRVGIGTTSPAVKLDVQASSADTTIRAFTGTVSTAVTSLHSSAAGALGTVTNHPLLIVTNNAEKMRITSDGNVGIGTASPIYKLDVTGTVRLGSFSFGALSANATGVVSSVQTIPIGIGVITANATLSSGYNYIIGTNSITVTLPASPNQGDKIGFVPRPGITTYTVARNSANIMALAENLIVDTQRPFALVYDNTANGWLIAHA